jgi:hypothetical protein
MVVREVPCSALIPRSNAKGAPTDLSGKSQVSEYLGESEERLPQPVFARQAVIAKPASTSKSKKIVAICLGATLAFGIFLVLRSQKHKVNSTAACSGS